MWGRLFQQDLFFVINCFLLLLIQVKVGVGVHASRSTKLSKHPVLLIVSFDGFRYDYMEKAETPTLRMLQSEGVSVPYMKSQFPTKTFPNHHSIATGLYPDVHGVTDNILFDPKYQRILSGFNNDNEFWNYSPDIIPIWMRNEQAKDERYSGCYMWAGSSTGYGEDSTMLPTHFIPKYNKSVPWEDRVDTVISWITDPVKPANLAFLYYYQPDSAGHAFGPESPQVAEEIKRTDFRVAHLVNKLKEENLYDFINLVVLSDHGMQTVVTERTFDITQLVHPSPDHYDRYGGTPILQIQPKSANDFDNVYNAFQNASKTNHFKAYKKSDPALSELKYGTNRRIMDIVLLSDIGYGFEDTRLTNGVAGVHGYDNREKTMQTFFVARGPAFKKGFRSHRPIENIDLLSLFSNILDIDTPPNNGTFSRVSSFLSKSGDQVSRGWRENSASLFLTTASSFIVIISFWAQGI